MCIRDRDITGTNTMFERVETGVVEAGESRIVTYTQRIDLQGGDYLISLGCTEMCIRDRPPAGLRLHRI